MAAWYLGMMFGSKDNAKKPAYFIVALAAIAGMIFISLHLQPVPPG